MSPEQMDKNLDAVDPNWAWAPFTPTDQHPWNRRLIAHLFRRAGFAAERERLLATEKQPPSEAVAALVADHREPAGFGTSADALAQTILATGNPRKLSAAWVYRLLFTPSQLLEKTTLFWHGHFATSIEKVADVALCWNQNKILRHHALGDFKQLTLEIASDPAMLIYLDSAVNRKAHPNENFARELMELFCLGEGNYTEQDVQQLARCFTGWEIKNKKFRKNRYQQDTGTKSILDQTGAFDGEDGVRIVLEQPQVEQFLARKLFGYFVADEPTPSDELLQPLADCLRQHDLHIAPALQLMFSSNLFFSSHAVGRKIKSPVEFIVGTLRSLQATANTELIADRLLRVGQGLFYPPNVKGWDGGRTWINSSTLLGRANLMADILGHDATKFDGSSLREYLQRYDVTDAAQAIDFFAECLLPVPLMPTTKQKLAQAAESSSRDPERSLRALLHSFTSLPQCQLG